MTDAAKASVWDVVWAPWGNVYSISGTATLDARFPGQWYQLESGLHYNWHRHYDPTLGRYTQPDPLGFVDGPSVYGYVRSNPQSFVDQDGRFVLVLPLLPPIVVTVTDIVIPAALAMAAIIAGDERRVDMPAIDTPADPGGGRCTCFCRAGDPNKGLLGFVMVEATASSCMEAAKDSCELATNRCQSGNKHHSKAKCTDGTYRSGSGTKTGTWRK